MQGATPTPAEALLGSCAPGDLLTPIAPPLHPKALSRGNERSYRARFHMLAIFCLLSLLNAVLWISFAPIEPLVRTYYGVDTSYVNALSATFMVLYLPGSVLGMYLMHRYSLRTSLLTGAALQAAGGWLRYLGTVLVHSRVAPVGGFATLLIGQCLAGLAQPIFTNAPAKLAGDWFPASERELATVVSALSNVLGNAAGQVMPSLMVTCHGGSSSMNCSHVSGMVVLLLTQAAAVTVAALWTALAFRSEPPTPPTPSASARRATRSQLFEVPTTQRSEQSWAEIRQHMMALLSNRDFLKILVGFGVGLGLFNGLLTDLSQLIQPLYCEHANATANATANGSGDVSGDALVCDYAASSADAGQYGGVMIGAGLVGAGLVGVALDATHMFRSFLKGGFVLSLCGMLFCLLELKPHNSAVLTVGFGLMGFCIMPLLPVALECSVECTYPVPEESSASLLMLAGNLVGLGTTYGLQALIGLSPVYDANEVLSPAAIFMLATICFALVFVLSFQGQYRRLHADRGTSHPHSDPGSSGTDTASSPPFSPNDEVASLSDVTPLPNPSPAPASVLTLTPAASLPEDELGSAPLITPSRPLASAKTPKSRVWPSMD